MAKIQLTKNNSPWGIINRPVGDNVYKHIINFAPDIGEQNFNKAQKKKNFIIKYLFDGDDYSTKWEQLPDRALLIKNDLEAEFNYIFDETENVQELLNKDYAIILKDGKEYFYSIIGDQINTKTIKYTAELDIFFTYDNLIKDTSGDIQINRSHVPRFNSKKEFYDLSQDSKNILTEQIYSKFSPVNQNSVQYAPQESYVNEFNKGTGYYIIYIKSGDVQGDQVDTQVATRQSDYKIFRLPYVITILPTTSFNAKFSNGEADRTLNGSEKIKEIAKQEYVVRIDYTDDPILTESYIKSYDKLSNTVTFKNTVTFFKDDNISTTWLKFDKVEFTIGSEQTLNINQSALKIYENFKIPNKDELKNVLNEAKLYNTPVYKLNLKSRTSEEMTLPIQLIYATPQLYLYLNAFYSFDLEQTAATYWNDNVRKGPDKGTITDNIGMPVLTYSEQYNNYLSTQNANSIATFTTGAAGVVAGVASLFIPGAKAVGGLLGLTGAGSIINEVTKREDLKNAPDQQKTASGTILLNESKGTPKPQLLEYYPYKSELKIMGNYFYKYGSTYNDLENELLPRKNERYYFNYLEATDLFNNIKGTYSTKIKQLVDQTFNAGVTIWHYRDESKDFNILNYTYDNTELE